MKYPCLIPKSLCKTPVHVEIAREGNNKYGDPYPTISKDVTCNYQDKSHTVFTEKKKEVKLEGTAIIPGDLAPEIEEISGGTITVFGIERQIYKGTKARNPDGTVNYTRLDVI